MEQHLRTLYHWSPTERRAAIQNEGLRLHSKPVVHGMKRTDKRLSFPYICFGLSPQAAWHLSGDMDWVREEYEDWDCWQITLAPQDSVHVLPCWGGCIQEVRTSSAIPADRVWLVGVRILAGAKEVLDAAKA